MLRGRNSLREPNKRKREGDLVISNRMWTSYNAKLTKKSVARDTRLVGQLLTFGDSIRNRVLSGLVRLSGSSLSFLKAGP